MLVIIGLIIIFNFMIPGGAKSQAIVSIPDTVGVKDSTIYIPIKVDLKNYGAACYEFEIIFNPDIIVAQGASIEGTLSEDWFGPAVNTNNYGKIIVGSFCISADTIRGQGNLVNLIFSVKGDIGDTTNLKFTYFTFNNGYPYAYKKSGIFKVKQESSLNKNMNISTPETIILNLNYPDPFVNSTTISYCLKNKQHVTIKIFNIIGQEVLTLKDDDQLPSQYQLQWDGRDKFGNIVSTGRYYCVMRTETHTFVEKMTFMK